MLKVSAFLGVLIFSAGATAHHSRLEFSDEVLEIEAELIDMTWANPHPDFTLRTFDDGGGEQLWYVQAFGSLYTLTRGGVSGDLFKIGETLRIALRPSTRREGVYLGTHALLADGTEVILNRAAQPRWSTNHVGGLNDWAADESQIVDAARENRGIFRVWSPEHTRGTRGSDILRPKPTEAALARRAEYDPFDNWNTRCESPGMPTVMIGPSAFEFIEDGGNIKVRGGHYEFLRTIHLADAQNPETQPASPLGYSVGRWEGNTLVVETTRVNWPYFDFFGTPQTEAVHILERLTLSDDQARLSYHITVTDPETLIEPSSMNLSWLALGEELPPINNVCDSVRGI